MENEEYKLNFIKTEYEDNYEAGYLYEYRGFNIEETYYKEDDCTHHSAVVHLDNMRLKQFNYGECVKRAQEYIDQLKKEKFMELVKEFETTQCVVKVYNTGFCVDWYHIYCITSYHKKNGNTLTRFGNIEQIESILRTYPEIKNAGGFKL